MERNCFRNQAAKKKKKKLVTLPLKFQKQNLRITYSDHVFPHLDYLRSMIYKSTTYKHVITGKKNFFSNSGSLWVGWLSHNRFGDKNFWLVRDSQRFSATIRGMLQLKNILPQFLRCAVGDGQRTSFWYDYWTDLGPLYLLFSSGPRKLQVHDSASVSDAVRNGEWFLPPARSENAITLQIVLSSTAVPSVEKGGDTYLWRIQSGGFANKFPSQITWDRLRTSSAEIVWHDVIWFKEEVPRCSFVA